MFHSTIILSVEHNFQFFTSLRIKGMSGGCYWESNLTAVWGQMVTEGGHAPLTESMALLGVPSLTTKAFITIEKRIGQWWWALFEESMQQDGAEEKALLFPMKSTIRESSNHSHY